MMMMMTISAITLTMKVINSCIFKAKAKINNNNKNKTGNAKYECF